jgi:hypothetical protein
LQVDVPSIGHWSSGSWPAGTLEHRPALPGSAHDLQVPEQATSQQTPCSHRVEAQSLASVHIAPRGFLPQLVPVQVFPVVQSALRLAGLQTNRHAPAVPH